MTRLFNVRLTDEEYEKLGQVAAGRGVSMSALVKDWVNRSPVLLTMDDMADPGKAHLQCDTRIADLEAEVKRLSRKTPVSDPRDMSGGLAVPEMIHMPANVTPAQVAAKQEELRRKFAAPNDDCGACGHDRQAFHLDGPCKAPALTKSKRCGCPAYVSAAEPF